MEAMKSESLKKFIPMSFAALIAMMVAGALMTGKFYDIDFQLGASVSMTAVFGLVWIFGVRYPDVTWMLVTSALLTLNNFLFPNQAMTKSDIIFFGTVNFGLMLSYGVFALSFFRFQIRGPTVSSVFALNISAFFLASLFLPEDILMSLRFDGSFQSYTGSGLLLAASFYGFTSLINLPPKRQRYVGIVALSSLGAAAVLFIMGKSGNAGASSFSFFFNYILSSAFGMLLLADLVIFHRNNLTEMVNRTHSPDEQISEAEGSIGRTIQSLLLPKTTKFESQEFTSEIIFSPSDSFGGDWYFVMESSYDRKIVMGDVSGSGVHGALGVAAIISLLHEARQRELDSLAIGKFINYRLIQLFERKISTTLTVISLATDGTVEICNCGGSGLIVLSRIGARHHPFNSTPLGISFDPDIAHAGLALAENDILISATDGHFTHGGDIKKLLDHFDQHFEEIGDITKVREAALSTGTRADIIDDQTLILIQKRYVASFGQTG